ncbi:MAG: helix-turn-helix domain-containing protein [Nitrospiraceae bacterium]
MEAEVERTRSPDTPVLPILKAEAARLLQIHRSHLYTKLKELGIEQAASLLNLFTLG